MTKFTKAQIIEAAEHAVEKMGPDYVYPRSGVNNPEYADCVYAEPDGSPSCIVGHVVAELAPEVFARIAELRGDERIFPADRLWEHDFETRSKNSVYALCRAQDAQDHGQTWGEALRRLKERLK